ncbi:discoidin domain-containing protein [Parasegetibacter sp. NRK P23]|uniref:galactose-binding domain-containing protein n=1 Tax=Parasegetibacter sp. NRK P23 TaxID=2942999 RepID=UPI002043F094|nr:discoidin domain-containing protein [Parasegetibacter sp. NRK P23]MCM5527251.1 discoidin domain-containing protein [Parasegetibacter sp. NRK P23]
MIRSLIYPLLAVAMLLSSLSMSAQNIALGKNAFSSSDEWAGNNPYLAVDGRGSSNANGTGGCNGECSRWSSGFNDDQWIYIDLAAQYQLSEVRIYWENASGRNFLVQVSNDASNWTTVHTVTNNTIYVNNFNMTGHTARYVRMFGQTRNTGYGFSIWEMEVYGTRVMSLSSNIALNAPAVASSTQHGGTGAANAVDGNGSGSQVNYYGGCTGTCTQWSSNGADDNWVYVDMGSIVTLTEVVLFWEGHNYPRSFQIQVSNDASNWTTVAALNNNYGTVNTMNVYGSSGRYVRMLGLQRNSGHYALYEMQVYNFTGILPVTFKDFTVKASGIHHELNWKVFMDGNTVFEIEKSSDARNFTTIGKVEGNGSALEQAYRFISKFPSGKTYYRLRYTEQGKAPAYSAVVSIGQEEKAALQVYPNPVTGGSFQVNLGHSTNGKVDIAIFNNAGVLVQKEHQTLNGAGSITIQKRTALVPGVYNLQILENGNLRHTRLLIAR